MKENWVYRRGDLYLANLGVPVGSKQGGVRPVVVLQNDVGNYYAPTITIAPLTSKIEKKRKQPTHFFLRKAKGLAKPSMVLAEQLDTCDKICVIRYLGRVSKGQMRGIDEAVIDEAQNVAERGDHQAQRSRLAKLLADRSDTMIMLSATPHDGRAKSFASLMNMLDPTAIADPQNYTPEDIKGLCIRRFKKDVKDQVSGSFLERKITLERCNASAKEEYAFDIFAEMQLEMDLGKTKGTGQLFKTSLEKSLFSSPAACIKSIEARLKKLYKKYTADDIKDIHLLENLKTALEAITPADFTRYQKLLDLIRSKEYAWNPADSGDRVVIFTERIETMKYLAERLRKDLGLKANAIQEISGGMSDAEQQRIVEDFGRTESPVRVLVASDVASEGLNLHYLSHRLIHFDIPWSLMVFQQRNGRIDRYGQQNRPDIRYMLIESDNKRIKGDMRIIEILITKEEQALKNIGDPSLLLGKFTIEDEELVVAETIESGSDSDAFEQTLDAGQLTLECLRYMYRMLFVLFIESRPELGYAPIKAQSYYSGYSLESLRDIADNIRDDVNEVGDGYYLHETLAKLYELIYDGYPKTEDELKKATGSDSLHDMFLIAPLKAHIFDPEYTKMITAAKLRNSCMLRIIDLMSLTRATGRKNGRRGRISYVNLGINQMGAVYEALLSYRGFIAEHDLYEVKRAGDSFNELDVGYFVSESELEQYTEDERVRYESGEKAGKLRMYEKGTFIYRLAGREREKSASYYTPEVLTKCLVKHALKELLEGKTADEILKLTICEPAMGSAAFLNEAINQLAEAYISRKEKETGEIISYEKRFNELQKVKMFIADRNVYGIDLNPVAVELAEVSLWLNTIYEGGFVPWFGTQGNNGRSLPWPLDNEKFGEKRSTILIYSSNEETENTSVILSHPSVLLLKELPCGLVVLLTVTAVKGGNILNGTLHRTAGHGVIHDRAIEFLTGRSILHVQLKLFPVETNPHETTVVGKGDSTVGIIPSICLIALQHRELDAVDSFQLLQRHAQSHCCQDINFHQSLTALVVCAQRGIPSPL